MTPSEQAVQNQKSELQRLVGEQSRRSAERIEALRKICSLRANLTQLVHEGQWIIVLGSIAKLEESLSALGNEAAAADRNIHRLVKLIGQQPTTESVNDLVARLSA